MRIDFSVLLKNLEVMMQLLAIVQQNCNLAAVQSGRAEHQEKRIGLLCAITLVRGGKAVPQLLCGKMVLHESDGRSAEQPGRQRPDTSNCAERQRPSFRKSCGNESDHGRP